MFRRHINWFIAVLLVTFVVGACIVRTRPSRPPPRGRPVYVKPDPHHHKHDHRKHKHKHRKH
jgi:hypothetical protein